MLKLIILGISFLFVLISCGIGENKEEKVKAYDGQKELTLIFPDKRPRKCTAVALARCPTPKEDSQEYRAKRQKNIEACIAAGGSDPIKGRWPIIVSPKRCPELCGLPELCTVPFEKQY